MQPINQLDSAAKAFVLTAASVIVTDRTIGTKSVWAPVALVVIASVFYGALRAFDKVHSTTDDSYTYRT